MMYKWDTRKAGSSAIFLHYRFEYGSNAEAGWVVLAHVRELL